MVNENEKGLKNRNIIDIVGEETPEEELDSEGNTIIVDKSQKKNLVTNEDEEEQKEGYIDLDDFEMDKEGAAQVDEIPIWHDCKNKYEQLENFIGIIGEGAGFGELCMQSGSKNTRHFSAIAMQQVLML